MEKSVEELGSAFQDALKSLTAVLTLAGAQPRQGGVWDPPPEVQLALAEFHSKADFFRASCDSFQALLENARHKLLCESLVDEARGIVLPPRGNVGVRAEGGEEAPSEESIVLLSALRLEQMSKAVRAIVHDLQHRP